MNLNHYPALAEAAQDWRWTPPDLCLGGRTIVITGAGDGIGRTAAQTFATYGANVVLVGRTRQKLESVFDWIEQHTVTQPVIVPCDLLTLDDASADALAKAIEDTYNGLDGILHNASLLGTKVPIQAYPTETWEEVMRVNATAPFVLTKGLLPLLAQRERAAIAFTSSSVGRAGRAYWGAYAVSKFAQEGLMETLADELAETSGTVVASINPGGTRTTMRANAYPGEDPASVPAPEAHMDLYLKLFALTPRAMHGAKLDARTWQGGDGLL